MRRCWRFGSGRSWGTRHPDLVTADTRMKAPPALTPAEPSHGSADRFEDAVEHPTFSEVGLLGLVPATENLVDGEELDLRQAVQVLLRGRLRADRPVEVLRDDRLGLRRVEEVQVSLGRLAGAFRIDVTVDQGYRRLGQDRDRGHNYLELALAELLEGQESVVLPGDQHVTHAALGESGGRTTCSSVKHRRSFVDRGHEVSCLRFVLPLIEREAPSGKVVPARTTRLLRVRRDDLDPRLGEILPVPDALWVPFLHHEHDGRGVRRRVVRETLLPAFRDLPGLTRDGVDVGREGKGYHVSIE